MMLTLFLAAFVLRLFRLEAQSLWWDEGISLHLATSSWSEIIADRVVNIHPPLYFFGLKIWVSLVGVTPFAARYSSALASLLQVTAVYTFMRRWFGREMTAVWTAAGLIAISPLSVIYGQEIRVYALLPLIYLALLTLTQHIIRPAVPSPSIRALLALGVVEWMGLHLHYIVLFIVVYVNIWALLAFYQQRRWRDLRRWLWVQVGVGLAGLPWLVAVIGQWTAVQAEANAGTFVADPVSWRFLLAQVWAFHLTGLAGALAHEVVGWLAGWAAVGIGGLLLWQRRTSLTLAAHWLIPLSSALVVWSVRSFSHPRYVAVYAVGLIPLAAYLLATAPRRWQRVVVGLPLVALSLWGLWTYFFDPGAAKDDVRSVAHYLEAEAQADDLIVIPDTDWSLPFEYEGEALVVMPGLDGLEGVWLIGVNGRPFVAACL